MEHETAARLQKAREDAGWSAEDLARTLDVSPETLHSWETAQGEPDLNQLSRFADLCRVSVDSLLTGKEDVLPEGSFFEKAAEAARNRFPYPVLVTLVYLFIGFMFGWWHPGWMLFLTIPLYYLPSSQRSYLKLLGNPVMITIIYLLLGFCCNLWHPGWLIFLAIPLLNAVAD